MTDLFTPIRDGSLELPNRVFMASMTRNRVPDNAPTPPSPPASEVRHGLTGLAALPVPLLAAGPLDFAAGRGAAVALAGYAQPLRLSP